MSGAPPTHDEAYWAERRRFRRFALTLACSVRDDVDRELTQVMMRNLSLGGCFVVTEHPLEEGTPIQLRLELPELDRVLDLVGLVVWRRKRPDGSGIGVQFTEVDPDDAEVLKIYLRELYKEDELGA